MEIPHLALLPEFQASRRGNAAALWFRDGRRKDWEPISWTLFAQYVRNIACALSEFDITAGDKIAIYSQNRPESFVVDFAGFRLRTASVPMYATSSREQVAYIISDASVKAIFVGDQTQFDNVIDILPQCPSLRMVVSMDPAVSLRDCTQAYYYSDLLQRGASSLSQLPDSEFSDDDIATLIYTSGTTGDPKGVVLTHGNYRAALRLNARRLPLSDRDRAVAFLPISHVFERAWSYLCLFTGTQVYVNYNPKEILSTLREVRPTVMCSVPRFWEKVALGIRRKFTSVSPMLKGLFVWALDLGRRYHLEKTRLGIRPSRGLRFKYWLADHIFFGPIRRTIGVENGNFFPVAGSSLSDHILLALRSMGIPILYGYGLTETTATVSCFEQGDYHIGSVGTVLDGVQVRISSEGEILVKGPTVTRGYFNRPEINAQSFTDDGFFRTGDSGRFDGAHLILTERIKDLFKTSNGKYIAPQQIEMRLSSIPYVEQGIVIGDRRPYVTAIIVPDIDALSEEARRLGIPADDVDALLTDRRIYDLVYSEILKAQSDMAPFEQVKKFAFIRKGFSIEGGELTNTLKFRRAVIMHHYESVINQLYGKVTNTSSF